MKNKISVITVCLNAGFEIEKTIKSVLNQNYEHFEYIIKDGGSIDKTNNLIDNYKNKFSKRGIKLIHIEKADNGIYNAMNQSLEYCSGEWVIFLNAGDTFFDENVLNDVFYRRLENDIKIIYGHTNYLLAKNFKFISIHNYDFLEVEWSLCHQSVFVRRELLLKYKFNEENKIVSDYEFFLKVYKEKYKFLRVNIIISNMPKNGISNIKISELKKENIILNKRYNLNKKKINCIFLNKLKEKIVIKYPFLSHCIFIYKQLKRMKKY